MTTLGIDRLIRDLALQRKLSGRRVAIAAHPASVTAELQHSIDALKQYTSLNITAAFGPQHGMRGDKQDNMVESEDYHDPVHGMPVFSLYGQVRRPTDAMMDAFDVLLFDIQDLGCRIYTYITTLLYLLEACAQHGKALCVLDRPNPAGRPVEGNLLQPGWESFVGAGPIAMRHGLTTGEMAQWFVRHFRLNVELDVVPMHGYHPTAAPGYGWPTGELSWVNPSPNASSLNMARFYAGAVLIEGTELSEGRGTSVPLELMGAPDIDMAVVMNKMSGFAPQWMRGARLRACHFQPTFHKHVGKLCHGFQVHTDFPGYDPNAFKPFRLTLLFLKAIRLCYPDYRIWRDFHYEYEKDRLAFDVINGGTAIREWVDDTNADAGDLERLLEPDETRWADAIRGVLLY
jgi:uncharacterized protein YbbC (DUF1343 family)